jgi:transposase InsO family protein
VRRRKRKRIGMVERRPLPKPALANQSWSMDFVSNGLANGRRIRCLTIVDDCTRECLAIEVDTSITGTRVKAVMERLADHHPPLLSRSDSGSQRPDVRAGESPETLSCAWSELLRLGRWGHKISTLSGPSLGEGPPGSILCYLKFL